MNQSSFAPSSSAFDAAVLSNRPTPLEPVSEAIGDPSPETSGRSFGLSIVIPAMNEEDSLDELHERVTAVCRQQNLRLEIVFIDDGSKDSTWKVMQRLAESTQPDERAESQDNASDNRTRAIQFRRNFGKAAALSAGFAIARGEIVMTMDADLQDDPDEIPRFLKAISEGCDVISGWKKVRHDPWHKVLPSRVFNAMVSKLTGVTLHDHNCGFKAYRHDVLQEVDLYGERHRFIPVLAAARGWRVGEIEVLHHPRVHGQSKYGVSRIGKGFLDLMSIYLLTGYGRRPLHLIGSAGLACFAAGSLGMLYLTTIKVIAIVTGGETVHLHSTAIFYYCILAVLLGAQCVLAGLIAELIVSVSAARDRSMTRMQMGIRMPMGSGETKPVPMPMQNSGYSVSETVGLG